MNRFNLFATAMAISWCLAGTSPAAASSILGTVDISAISSKFGSPPVFLDLAFNPGSNVFYVSDSLGQPGGSIYTVDMSGRILHTLSISSVIGNTLRAAGIAYDQRSGHIFLLAEDISCTSAGCDFEYSIIEMSTDGSTIYVNAPLQGNHCSERMTVTTDSIWVSCGRDQLIGRYTRTGGFIENVSLVPLFTPQNIPFALAPDFGGSLYGHFLGGILVDDFNGQRLLDVDQHGNLMVAVPTTSLSPQGVVVAIASDPTTGRIFLNVDGSTIYIMGSDFLTSPTVGLSNSSWTFSATSPGSKGGLGQVFVTNLGQKTLNIAGARLIGNSPDQFTLTNNCPSSLGIHHTCNLQFTFAPTKTGPFKAAIQLNDDADVAPQTISLNGVGSGPALWLSNYSWGFKSHAVGQTSGAGTVYVTNPGNASLHFASISMTGANPGDFKINGTTCGAALSPYTTCGVTFNFTPTAVGTRTVSLVFDDDAIPGQQVVTISGSGTLP